MWLYCEDDQWVECELLHEFMYDYQIRYYINDLETVEVVVKRESIREISNDQQIDI